jgi:hypothetical protein
MTNSTNKNGPAAILTTNFQTVFLYARIIWLGMAVGRASTHVSAQ